MTKTIENIFLTAFRSVYNTMSMLESKIAHPDNISNWITQLLSNEHFDGKSHPIELKIVIDGNPIKYVYNDEFMPALSKGHGQATAYKGNCKDAKFVDDKGNDTREYEICKLFAYLAGWLLMGKPLAIVNQGRGLILKDMITDLKVSYLDMTIKHVSLGGNPEKTARDMHVNLDELNLAIAFQCERSKRVTCLPSTGGHDTRPIVSKPTQFKRDTFKV